ncbi:conserved Plasmodium protein, unknown function [Plasmodium vivax]|uniref:PUB domain-containing protein n=5 Tax=Plasmodium vivax TaxID=5855 RepID=A0A0J9T4R8_PLAVI|nr:hypothetical protein PVIIG_00481 [Plasmodium vivax India VII]KMZ84852.1 hypothetical protein PVBG_04268 [Plasmodium vivax Brazil I]KMZ90405.1 hypothetical protein PVMG_03255 [Plasmodium vivax Mauritania I]KMZ97022.1 hypothetical protein PVNG_00050 [Plasmodium vivax North Korean]CAG9471830.1 unnamed protein product [Plasmodium vivax]
MDPENEVVKLLLRVGQKINKGAEQLKPFIKIIVEDNWLDSLESLKNLGEDEWDKLKIPIRLLDEIKKELGISKEEDKSTEHCEKDPPNHIGKIGSSEKRAPRELEHQKGEETSNLSSLSKKQNLSNLHKKLKKGALDECKNTHQSLREDCELKNQSTRRISTSGCTNVDERKGGTGRSVKVAENGEGIKSSFIKYDKEKLEKMIESNGVEIPKEEIFYLSYEDENYTCRSYSEEKISTIKCINEAEKLKKINMDDLKSIIPILCKIVKNILINPNAINTRILKSTNDIMKNKILIHQEARNFLLSIGFVQVHVFYVMERVDTLLLLCIYESLQHIAKDSIKIDSPPKAAFDPFKSNIVCVDTLKKGKIKSDEQIDKLLREKKEQMEKLMNQAVDLNPKIYRFQPNAPKGGSYSSSDSEKEERSEDLALLIPNIRNLYKEQTFKSKTKLELEKMSTRKVYSKAVLKILFPDSYVLEMSFSAGTQICEVNESIKKFLNPSVAHKKWFIYETPGICKFDPQKRLSDCNLIPCALLRFKVDPAQDDEAHNSFLSDDAIAKYFVKS